jgi:hypothetical protein
MECFETECKKKFQLNKKDLQRFIEHLKAHDDCRVIKILPRKCPLCHKSKWLIDYRSIQQLIKMNHLNENEIIQKDQRVFSTIFKTKEIKKENINTLFDSDSRSY